MEERETVLRAQAGDGEAFERLVEQYSAGIYRLCLGLCGNGFDAEDAVQETFIDAFLYLKSLSDPDRFPAWLRSIARRKAARKLASRRYDEDIDALADFLPSSEASPLDLLLDRENGGRVAEAFGRLSEKRRVAAELFYLRGMRVREIAARLDVNENTVKSRLYDAREQLRKELSYMNGEQKDNITLLKEKIKKQLISLNRYYSLHGGQYDEGFKTEVDSTLKLIEEAEEGETKNSLLADALKHKIIGDKSLGEEEKKALTERKERAAKDGKNAAVIADALIDDYFEMGGDEKKLEFLDKTALPEIENYKGSETYGYAKGALLFWRGRTLCESDRFDEARADFTEAVRLIDPSDAYHANAVAALRTLDRLAEAAERIAGAGGWSVTGEGFLRDGTRLLFKNQPGFDIGSCSLRFPRDFASFTFFASMCRRTLFDAAMNPGDTITDEKNHASLTCISKDERIRVKAGEFADCLHMRTEAKPEWFEHYVLDAWYAPGVGPVKVIVSTEGAEETYELTEYEIRGGEGYMPFAVGNRWAYENPDIPDWVYQTIERSVEYTDGTLTNEAVTEPYALKKGYEQSEELDSSVYLSFASALIDEWKIAEAVEMLKKAVRLNVHEESVRIALYGIEALSRFLEYQKKGYRFCPSSVNALTFIRDADGVRLSFSPDVYFGLSRYGERGRYEDRIFGIKTFRYLNQFMGRIWDRKWVPGYREEKTTYDGLPLVFTVEEGGTVTVPAGTFEHCRKITILVKKPEDKSDHWYFEDNYSHVDAGRKEYWFAPGVGLVKSVSTWGEECEAGCVLVSYSVPAAQEDDFYPVEIGNAWEYEEPHLAAEGYRAKRIDRIASGMNGRYLVTDSQEFVCFRTEEEYRELVKQSHKY